MIKVVWYCTIVSVLSYDVALTVILYVVSARRSSIEDTIPRPKMIKWMSKFITCLHVAVCTLTQNYFYEYFSHRCGSQMKNKLSEILYIIVFSLLSTLTIGNDLERLLSTTALEINPPIQRFFKRLRVMPPYT